MRASSVLLFLLGLAAAPLLRAQASAEPMTHLHGRQRVDLSGDWRYLVEQFGQAIHNRNIRRDYPADQKEQPGGLLIEYDWDTAPTMRIPGDWNSQDPALWWYEGTVWFRRRLPAPADLAGKRAFLYFEAANHVAHVWLNNRKLGLHEGGFTPFMFEVTGALQADNSLVVAVENERVRERIPSLRTDWWNYGGLTRPVWLVVVPETYLHDYTLRFSDPADGPRIDLSAALDGPDRAGRPVTFSIAELGLRATVAADADGRAAVTFRPPAVRRWSPADPKRYEVVIEAGDDRLVQPVGLRTLAVRGTEILLNGEPVFLRGICLHEEAFDAQGRRATGEADYARLLEAARALNVNFVRLAHYPYGAAVNELADRLGLLTWAEIPVYWEDIPYDNPQTLLAARQMLREMIQRDKNHASVAFWSVANETPVTEHRLVFLRQLIEDARRLDPTRLVSAALKSTSVEAAAADGAGGAAARGADRRIQRIDDPLGAHLDVLAVNTYVGWYGAAYPDAIQDTRWESRFAKPVVLSEFGADALRGHRGDRTERWTEDFQAWLIDETMKSALATPFIVGTAPWLLKDFRSPRRPHGRFQQYWNRKGLVDELGRPKLAWQVMKDHYDRLAAGGR
jgi:beta-glucuronidase